jgi:hypothetical protein
MPSLPPSAKVLAVFASDLHISETAPVARSCEPDWLKAVERMLVELQRLWCGLKRPPIFYCGDVFHKWNVGPEAVNLAMAQLPQGYAIAGNHDLPNHRYEDIKRSAYWTLVEANTVENLGPGEVRPFDGFSVQAFPWGSSVEPPKKHPDPYVERLPRVALIHDYCWTHGNEHPGAPLDKHVDAFAEKLQGYTAAFFGDNHSPHTTTWTKPRPLTIFNCGCLIPRRSPERHYRPRVGLLLSDGSVRENFLDTSKDLWLDPEETARKVLEDGGEVREFVDLLKRAGTRVMCFRSILTALLDEKDGRLTPKVKSELREFINDCGD